MEAAFFETLFFIILGGLAFIALGEFLFLDLTGLGKKKARKHFPIAAQSLGFKLKERRNPGNIGTYEGRYEGYNFAIETDQSAKVLLDMRPVRGIQEIKTTQGGLDFNTGSKFDKLFTAREADSSLRQRIVDAKHFQDIATQMAQRWKRATSSIRITESQIICKFKYGSSSYIPASVLKEIVPQMVAVADAIQKEIQTRPKKGAKQSRS